ncbi:hypothetical protein [Nocardioides pantholopis]|uniref:hypothetical protein n=1 Tax=Nocardioides pantholopis TaxID=2483798 RepID=UPI000FD9324C|nr:hypothetical protein [Nocardioides pantholopis]
MRRSDALRTRRHARPPQVLAAGGGAARRLDPGRARPVVAGVLAAVLLAALVAGVVGAVLWSVVRLFLSLAAG